MLGRRAHRFDKRPLTRNSSRYLLPMQSNVALSFDQANFAAFRLRTEGRGSASLTSPSGAANPMNEIARGLGQVVVDHMSDAVDVNAAGRDVGCD